MSSLSPLPRLDLPDLKASEAQFQFNLGHAKGAASFMHVVSKWDSRSEQVLIIAEGVW